MAKRGDEYAVEREMGGEDEEWVMNVTAVLETRFLKEYISIHACDKSNI